MKKYFSVSKFQNERKVPKTFVKHTMMLLICGYGNDTLDYKLKSLSAVSLENKVQPFQEVKNQFNNHDWRHTINELLTYT